MMPRFMSYQMIILNGEKRGERFNVEGAVRTIGRDASCDLPLPDPLVSDVHAIITPTADGLVITAQGETSRLSVNKAHVTQSTLKHGDVIEIGSTRLFIQAQRTPGTWGNLAEFYKWKRWITIGVPILILIAITITLKRCYPSAPQAPIPPPAPRRAHSELTDTNNTDWMVTNVPSIAIHSSIILTALPPDIIEAREIVLLTRSNNIQQEIELALREVEFAASFLDQAAQHPQPEPVRPDTATHETNTIQAEGLKN